MSVVLPFYNEEGYLGATLASLAAQTRPPAEMLLVDNASTDASVEICRAFAADHPEIKVRVLSVETPGKIHALEGAMAEIATEFAAFCDADTYYPPHYLALADRLFAEGGAKTVAAMAVGVSDGRGARFQRFKGAFVGRLLAKQCHTGGYGQVFRTEALRRAGGYCVDRWRYVLSDHEIMQRVLQHGRGAYHPDFWCRPSDRRTDRSGVRWTLAERLLYHLTPFQLKNWYFYKFLGPRFARRGLMQTRLRTQSWKNDSP
ncbi:MAG: glycosyltransferase family A protein [Pseudomonadota bacterium]